MDNLEYGILGRSRPDIYGAYSVRYLAPAAPGAAARAAPTGAAPGRASTSTTALTAAARAAPVRGWCQLYHAIIRTNLSGSTGAAAAAAA